MRVEEAREKHKEWWGYKGREEEGTRVEGGNGPRRREDRRVDGRGVMRGGVYRGRGGGEGRVSISLAFWGWMVRYDGLFGSCCNTKKRIFSSGIPKSLITPSISPSPRKRRENASTPGV